MIPSDFFDFDPPAAPYLGTPFFGDGGGVGPGGGGQNFFAYCGRCACMRGTGTRVLNNFTLHMDSLTHGDFFEALLSPLGWVGVIIW